MSEAAKRTAETIYRLLHPAEEGDEQVGDVVDRLRGAANGTCGLDEAEAMALCFEAAKEVERLRNALKKLRSAARDTAVYADAPKTHEMDDGEAGVVCAWEVLHNLRLAITDADAAVA